jgi:hypothetical protein
MLRRRVVVVIVLTLAAVAYIVGTNRSPVPLRTFSNGGVSFSFPASWTLYRYQWPPSTLRTIIAYLSNEVLHDPCQPSGSSTTCGQPIDRLGAGGVLVTWTENGSPAWNFKTFKQSEGRHVTIGGRPARLLVETSGRACGSVDADELIEIVIPNGRYNWYEMNACIRGPDVSTAEAQVKAMLHTVQFG